MSTAGDNGRSTKWFYVLIVPWFFFSLMVFPRPLEGSSETTFFDLDEVSEEVLVVADATAGMILKSNIHGLGNRVSAIFYRHPPLDPGFFCPLRDFSSQGMAADCSGVLIASDLLLTAGHCVDSQAACSNSVWVFGYAVEGEEQRGQWHDDFFFVDREQLYGCKEIVAKSYRNRSFLNGLRFLGPLVASGDNLFDRDYALVRLEREVKGRRPISLRTMGQPALDQGVFVIGHPRGLPLKISSLGEVVQDRGRGLAGINIYGIGGLSGAPVVNADTGLLEGIAIRSFDSHVWDDELSCYHQEKGDGVSILFQRITYILSQLPFSLRRPLLLGE